MHLPILASSSQAVVSARAAHRVLLPAPDLVRRLVPNSYLPSSGRVRHLALDRAARLVLRPVLASPSAGLASVKCIASDRSQCMSNISK
jgi:hypothetical protein